MVIEVYYYLRILFPKAKVVIIWRTGLIIRVIVFLIDSDFNTLFLILLESIKKFNLSLYGTGLISEFFTPNGSIKSRH